MGGTALKGRPWYESQERPLFFETVYANLKFKEAELWTNNNIKSYNAR